MASIRSTFIKGVNTIFNVFNEAVKIGTYDLLKDDGFDVPVPLSCPIRCIFESFTEKDVASLSFSDLIQPSDVKGIIPFEDVTIAMTVNGGTMTFGTSTYTVEGFETDPMDVIYTLLLRKV